MSYRELEEQYGEGKDEHFDDVYDYIRYLERTGQKHEANLIRRDLEREESDE